MRPKRVIYEGSMHHIMNHGLGRLKPFDDSNMIKFFLRLIKDNLIIYDIDLYAICIMQNHFHIVLKNNTNRLPEFMRTVCSNFALVFNKINHRRGTVFQDRYLSTLIQDESYMIIAIVYALLNPVRAGMIKNPFDYKWSSINELYRKDQGSNLIDSLFVENIFNDYGNFVRQLAYWSNKKKLPIIHHNKVYVLGERSFLNEVTRNINKREQCIKENNKKMRRYDTDKQTQISLVIQDIINKTKCDPLQIKYSSQKNKRIRMQLLIMLRERCGLKYNEIILMKPFRNMKYNSLGCVYNYAVSLRNKGKL